MQKLFAPNNNSILQWNCNGIRSKKSYLEELTLKYNLKILALQETKIEKNIPLTLKHFKNIYRRDRTNNGGGVCIAVHDSIPSYEIKFKTDLEIIACRVIFRNLQITICNVYFNKDTIISKEILDELKALPPPLLILGILIPKG